MFGVTIVQVTLALAGAETVADDAQSYAEARRVTTETGKPMVVMVSTEWCRPCQMMKKTVLPRIRERGLLRKVAFTVVNPDRDGELAQQLTGGGPIPQLVMFRKTARGWKRQKLVGGQSVETVEQFINEGLAQNEVEKKSAADPGKEGTSEGDEAAAHHVDAAESEEAAQHG
jgi:thioredoxin-like negative regulator of GroEL